MLCAATVFSPVTQAAHASTTGLPGNKPRYVVSMTNVPNEASPTSGENCSVNTAYCYFARLAQYNFSSTSATTGKVSETYWYWSQSNLVGKTPTNATTNGCALVCAVNASTGFQETATPRTFSGTYVLDSGASVVITWSNNQIERWTITAGADGTAAVPLAVMHIRSTNFATVQGFGYGSNASWSQAASIASLAGTSFPSGEFFQNDGNKTTHFLGSAFATSLPAGSACSAQCLSFEAGTNDCQPHTAGGSNPAPYRYRYADLSTLSLRKNVENVYSECLNNKTDGAHDVTCYAGNMHVRDLLQILDDNDSFRGWVGVESSLYSLVPAGGAAYIGAFHMDAA